MTVLAGDIHPTHFTHSRVLRNLDTVQLKAVQTGTLKEIILYAAVANLWSPPKNNIGSLITTSPSISSCNIFDVHAAVGSTVQGIAGVPAGTKIIGTSAELAKANRVRTLEMDHNFAGETGNHSFEASMVGARVFILNETSTTALGFAELTGAFASETFVTFTGLSVPVVKETNYNIVFMIDGGYIEVACSTAGTLTKKSLPKGGKDLFTGNISTWEGLESREDPAQVPHEEAEHVGGSNEPWAVAGIGLVKGKGGRALLL